MKLTRISLKVAVIIPFISLILLIVTILGMLWSRDYRQMSNEQGFQMVQSINDITQEKLKNLMEEPLRLLELSGEYISANRLYEKEDLFDIEEHQRGVYKALKNSLPQISTISYGDSEGNFVGIRDNNSGGSYSLMLKDSRTQDQLTIYEGDTIHTDIVSRFDEYDPRSRSWYIASEEPTRRWSEIYVNYDEKMEATISAVMSILGEDGSQKATVCYDVKLTGINEFLKEENQQNSGIIYIVDNNRNLIAHSGDEAVMKIIKGSPPTGELMRVAESDNILIQESSKYLEEDSIVVNGNLQVEIGGKDYYILVSEINVPQELGWKIAILIPETDIIGDIENKQKNRMIITMIVAVIGSILGFSVLDFIIRPVTRSTKAVAEFSEGNWDVQMLREKIPLKETTELITAFNTMAHKIKNSFEQVKLSEEKYRILVENIDNMIYSMDSEGILLSANRVLEEASGFKREELVGKSVASIFEEDRNVHNFNIILTEINEKKQKINFTFEYINSHTKYIATFVPMLDEEGNIDMILATNTDITELTNAENEIKRLHELEKENLQYLVQEKTEELSAAFNEIIEMEKYASLGSLVSGVAHEINTPLGVAVTATSFIVKTNEQIIQLLKDGEMRKSDFVNYIDTMEESADILGINLNRAADLIKNFKQMAVNQSIEEKTSFNLYEFIQSLLISLKHEYKNTNTQIEINCSQELIVNSYSASFSQIFTNLIMNSLIHGFKGKGGIITIHAEVEGEILNIIYSDNGFGILDEDLKHIFEPFFTTNRNKGGSGLGLSIVYNIVTGQLGGKITCESGQVKGTKFNIKIPLIQEAKDER